MTCDEWLDASRQAEQDARDGIQVGFLAGRWADTTPTPTQHEGGDDDDDDE